MLNWLWLGFFVVAAVAGLSRWLLGDDPAVFAAMVESLFAMAKLSVEVMVLLFGTLTLWLGLLRIAEKAGLVDARPERNDRDQCHKDCRQTELEVDDAHDDGIGPLRNNRPGKNANRFAGIATQSKIPARRLCDRPHTKPGPDCRLMRF